MDNLMEIAEECEKNEFCTNCSKRKGCGTRAGFYNKESYEKSNEGAIYFSAFMAMMLMGLSLEEAMLEACKIEKECDKKRNRELAEHPTYSEE